MANDKDARRQVYAEKLKDPRWQQLRLRIFERDEWACQVCGDKTTMLAVHHRYYLSGREPWDYEPAALVTLCQPCHEIETIGWPEVQATIIPALKQGGWWAHEALALIDGIKGLMRDRDTRNLPALVWAMTNANAAEALRTLRLAFAESLFRRAAEGGH